MHQETTPGAGVRQPMSIGRWLFNPFVRVGGEQALAIGLSVVVVTGLAAAAADVHFGGLLRLHTGSGVPLWVPVAEGLLIWSAMSVLLALVALLVAPRTVRLVDIAGTQALARTPLLFAALAHLPAPVRESNAAFVAAAVEGRLVVPTPLALVAGLLGGICAIWMVQLMWKAFAVSCNQRGGRAVAIFVAVVITGHVATSLLLAQTFGGVAVAGLPGGS